MFLRLKAWATQPRRQLEAMAASAAAQAEGHAAAERALLQRARDAEGAARAAAGAERAAKVRP